jgi:hypothetical protein
MGSATESNRFKLHQINQTFSLYLYNRGVGRRRQEGEGAAVIWVQSRPRAQGWVMNAVD